MPNDILSEKCYFTHPSLKILSFCLNLVNRIFVILKVMPMLWLSNWIKSFALDTIEQISIIQCRLK